MVRIFLRLCPSSCLLTDLAFATASTACFLPSPAVNMPIVTRSTASAPVLMDSAAWTASSLVRPKNETRPSYSLTGCANK